MTRAVKTLLFSSLYPSSTRPLNGIFVETRLRHLLGTGRVQTKVVAPVPWFPSADPRYGRYAAMAATPPRENHNGIDVLHPRYLVIPKIGMNVTPFSMAIGAMGPVRTLLDEGFDFDVIDAHYYYPDGVAAALLALWFGKPFTVTARGTDLNLIPQHWWPRQLIKWAAGRADASIGVCAALVDVLREWGMEPSRLHVMRNGVDLQRFRPVDQAAARAELELSGSPLLLSVGHMNERKGHHIAIDALAALRTTHPDARLVIVGDGAERTRLEAQVGQIGIGEAVRFAGAVANADLLRWYSAADVLLLCSSREGWPNVLLESMACGTPVVATAIWGTPEVVGSPVVGRLVPRRDGAAFADAVVQLLAQRVDRLAVRRYAEGFSWESTSRDQLELFQSLSTPS